MTIVSPTPAAGETGPVPDAEVSGYAQLNWKLVPLDYSDPGDDTELSEVNDYLHILALPDKTGNVCVVEKAYPARELNLKFFGVGAENSQYTVRIWGVKNGPRVQNRTTLKNGYEFFGDPLASLTVTLGASTLNAESALFPDKSIKPENYRWADIVAATDYSITPGILQVGDAADCAAVQVLDKAPGYSHFIIEFAADTATGFGALYC